MNAYELQHCHIFAMTIDECATGLPRPVTVKATHEWENGRCHS
ncbi:DUF1870 family protein [Escherichia coli]